MEVTFVTPYEFTPVVTVTPQESIVPFAIDTVSPDGFTIRVEEDVLEDTVFSWIAVSVVE